ncbi:MAG: DNA repair protein RecN [Firmicutes bacterium]|nr:DNA repair protein RecN [Bacillota bacterium]
MLERLYVKNFALIDETDIEFEEGLNVLSGETGAGKSILIGSLNFVLGGKADKDIIKKGAQQAEVSAVLYVDENVKNSLREVGIETEDDNTVLLTRTFNISGRSSCRVNGKAATVGIMKEAAKLLVDIHGQHEHQSLSDSKKHIFLLDKMCPQELEEEKEKLEKLLEKYKSIDSKLSKLDMNDEALARQVDMYKFQKEEIEEANLEVGEEERLKDKRTKFLNLANIRKWGNNIVLNLKSAEEGSALDNISEALGDIDSLSSVASEFNTSAEELNNAYCIIEDVADKVRSYLDELDYDEGDIDTIEQRLDTINKLKRKYGSTIEDILAFLNDITSRLEEIENSEVIVEKLNKEKKELLSQINKVCESITSVRAKTAEDISQKTVAALRDMGMENALFSVNISEKPFDRTGKDKVEFMISANKGEDLKPLSKIASGGEMSRVMLALKNVLADADDINTFIFDEIDTGISGRTAQKVAEKMSDISKEKQILCITHLPQIAAMADHNYIIKKTTEGEKTFTDVTLAQGDKVFEEIARLIGGSKITASTMEAAKEMKQMNESYKAEKR